MLSAPDPVLRLKHQRAMGCALMLPNADVDQKQSSRIGLRCLAQLVFRTCASVRYSTGRSHTSGCPIPSPLPRVVGGTPSARLGDTATRASTPDVVAKGSLTVLIGGRPATRMGDPTAHGGVIVNSLFDRPDWRPCRGDADGCTIKAAQDLLDAGETQKAIDMAAEQLTSAGFEMGMMKWKTWVRPVQSNYGSTPREGTARDGRQGGSGDGQRRARARGVS
jgi:uncharacterized Zn-binding protein involved in type VI secretion